MSEHDFGKVENKQFKSIYLHPLEFEDWLQQILGICDAFTDFNHFFQRAEIFMIAIKRTQRWLETNADGKAKDPRYEGKFPTELPKEAYEKINKVWRGKIWRICVTFTYENEQGEIVEDIDADKSYFVFERPTHLLADEKAVEVPALQHMIPSSLTKDNTEIGVRIREQTEFSTAWFGADFAILNLDARFHYNFTDEQRPFFESDEQILELRAKTDYVSRDYFNTVIDILINEYEKYETDLYLFLQALIKTIKQGQGEQVQQQDNSFVAEIEY